MLLLVRELSASESRESVGLRPAVVLGDAPLGANPALVLQSMERGIQRALVELQNILGELLDAYCDAPSMRRLPDLQCLENEQLERSLK
jgi:hypothetical protein